MRENTLIRGGVIIIKKRHGEGQRGDDLLPILRENTLIRGGVIIIIKQTRRHYKRRRDDNNNTKTDTEKDNVDMICSLY